MNEQIQRVGRGRGGGGGGGGKRGGGGGGKGGRETSAGIWGERV